MKKRTISLAAAGLALGIVLIGSVTANAATFPGLSCTNSVNGPYVGIAGSASGTSTITVVNGPSSWGKSFPYSSTLAARKYAAPSSLSSASYFTTTGGSLGWSANGCFHATGTA